MRFKEICLEIAEILTRKRHDYLGRYGIKGITIRLGDKFERLHELVWEGKEPNFESIEDTLKDIAGYAVLGLDMLRESRSCNNCGENYLGACSCDTFKILECKKNALKHWRPKDAKEARI